MKIRFGTIELARGLAMRESPRQFSIETAREVQEIATLRADTARPVNRGNARTRVRFSVARRHDNLEAATRFALTHAGAIAGAADCLTFLIEDGAGAAELYLKDAAAAQVRCSTMGLTTDVDYEFLGSAITPKPPAV